MMSVSNHRAHLEFTTRHKFFTISVSHSTRSTPLSANIKNPLQEIKIYCSRFIKRHSLILKFKGQLPLRRYFCKEIAIEISIHVYFFVI